MYSKRSSTIYTDVQCWMVQEDVGKIALIHEFTDYWLEIYGNVTISRLEFAQ